ncbi:MAG TPA: parallel beta-helix domain-containing protein [Myxococcales bacterium]|jgi:parallel beta-helix repeat protein|nr:parallel beta-helix domain-containing protein [Myxococcales bacterium]
MRLAFVVAAALAALPVSARTLVVHPGDSIRAAVARASPGDRIQVLPGTYREGGARDRNAVTVTTANLTIVGVPHPGAPVVLENAGAQQFGFWVSPANSAGAAQDDPEHPPCGLDGTTLRGFSLQGFTLRGFAVHGAHLACVDGFTLSGNTADGNGVYGLFPVVSRHGLITGNTVTNTQTDAGIYVGQSDDVLVTSNHVSGNLLGIEIENSRNCAVVGNTVTGNTQGIFVDILPFLERNTQENTLVAFNEVRDNNRDNTAEEGDILAVVPSGTGILIAGGHATTVLGNDVRGNQFTGVAVASLCFGLALQGQECAGLDIDPDPSGDRIVGNRVTGNGGAKAFLPPPFNDLAADLIWDGSGTDNCWSRNLFATSVPPVLPACK